MYERMGKVSLFPVSLPTENSCYSPYQATGTSLSGIKTLIYIFWISRVGFSIPYETRTAQTRRVIIHGVATAGGSFSAAEESTDYIPDLISPISTRAEMPPNRSYYHMYALEYQCLSCFYGGSGVSGTGTGDRAQAGGI